MINQIQEDTGAEISIEDDGTVYIGATDGPSAEAARAAINAIANPHDAGGRRALPRHRGEDHDVRRVRLAASRARTACCTSRRSARWSAASASRTSRTCWRVGQKVQVEIAEIDPRGKLSLVPVLDGGCRGDRPRTVDAAAAGGRRTPDVTRRPLPLIAAGRPGRRRPRRAGRRRHRAPFRPARRGPGAHRGDAGPALGHRRLPGSASARATRPTATTASTHFLEHLLFKGTAAAHARWTSPTAFDAVGGEANAVTGKEHTCYYARVLDDDLPMAVDVICDMVTSAAARRRRRREPSAASSSKSSR